MLNEKKKKTKQIELTMSSSVEVWFSSIGWTFYKNGTEKGDQQNKMQRKSDKHKAVEALTLMQRIRI